MKRILLFAAVSVALTGCVNDETESFDATPSNKKITFEAPFLGKVATRATPINSTLYPEDGEFMVWGKYHKETYSNWDDCSYYMGTENSPVKVSKHQTESYWLSSSAYYWPKEGKLTFAAYSPAEPGSGTFTHTKNGLQITDFTVSENADVDVMYSDRSYNCTSESETTVTPGSYQGIQILFHHALSSICFKAKTEADYSGTMEINIKKIEVKNVANQGTFNENLTDGNNSTTRTNPSWTSSGNQNYTAFNNEFKVSYSKNPTEITDAKTLILLPQNFENENATIVITYTMTPKDNQAFEFTQELKLNTSNDGKWEINKQYTYNLIFSLKEIHFAPVVEDWVSVPVTPDTTL